MTSTKQGKTKQATKQQEIEPEISLEQIDREIIDYELKQEKLYVSKRAMSLKKDWYKCYFCGYTTSDRSIMTGHINTAHSPPWKGEQR